MAIGGEQSGRDYKARSRDASAKTLRMARQVIDPVDISYRLSRIVQCRRRKRLLAFQIGHLAGELVHLPLQTGGFRRSVVVRHDAGARQRQHAQHTLDKALPGFNQFAFRTIRIEHAPPGPARREMSG